MHDERTVTTRQLLRNFRSIKRQLLSGEVNIVHITVGREAQLELTPKRHVKTAAELARAARALKRPIHIRRTYIFDELLRPRRKP